MSQRAKAMSDCRSAGYAMGGFARPAKGGPKGYKAHRKPKNITPPAGLPASPDSVASDPMGSPALPSVEQPAAPYKRGGRVKC